MGALLEALWGFEMNRLLAASTPPISEVELVWLPHEYNDFACVPRDAAWEAGLHGGELFRIEAKSMDLDADESKGHFDELSAKLGMNDLLLVLLWRWKEVDTFRFAPHVEDHFIDLARPVAVLRDELHVARRGSFVDRALCPDEHPTGECTHHGEPLNAKGKRERSSGPATRKPSGSSFAANFGGLVRMLGTASEDARRVFRRVRAESDVAHRYISFIYSNRPHREYSQYTEREWRQLARQYALDHKGKKAEVVGRIRVGQEGYQDAMRTLFAPTANPDG